MASSIAPPVMATTSLPHRIRTFYERVNVERAAAMDGLPALYASDLHFANPVQEGRGIDAFHEAWRKAFRLYRHFEFHGIATTGDDEAFSLSYVMRIRFLVGPMFEIPMMTECRAREGRVEYLRDYFDPIGAVLSPLAPLRWLYRVTMRLLIA